MLELTFRPLRRLKCGKIAVASYMQWRKVMVASHSKFKLIVLDEYKAMPPDEQVHNHKGEPLFFFTYRPDEHTSFPYPHGLDCDGVPTFSHNTADRIAGDFDDMEQFEPLTVGMVTKWWGWLLYRMENVCVT